MSEELERELRRMLRPVDPGEEFTRRVMARVPNRRWAWRSAALAASVVLVAVGLGIHERRQQEEAGLAARAQVLEALHVTSKKLDLAYRLVNTSSHPTPQPAPGPG